MYTYKCEAFAEFSQVFLEPFSRSYYYGPDRVSQRYKDEPIHEDFSFENIRKELEDPYPGFIQVLQCTVIRFTSARALSEASTVFVKDMAYYLVNRLDSPACLPKNYVHTFLLRDPHKAIYSLYKMSLNTQLTGACCGMTSSLLASWRVSGNESSTVCCRAVAVPS